MIKITNKDFIWAYLGFFMDALTNLFLLPLTLTMLSQRELGLWYTFLSIGGIVSLLDMGLVPIITRNITCAWCGAEELVKSGINHIKSEKTSPNKDLIIYILKTCKSIYGIMSIIALLILVIIGTPYISNLIKDFFKVEYMYAWAIFCIAITINIYYYYWNGVLIGIGAIKENKKIMILSRITQFIVSIILLLLGWGIIATVMGYLCSGILTRYLAKLYFNKIQNYVSTKELSKYKVDKSKKVEVFKKIWHNSYKVGCVTIGLYLINQATTLICSYFYGLEVTSSYGLSTQVLKLLVGISSVIFNTYQPIISASLLSNDIKNCKSIFSFSIVAYVVIYSIGIIGIVTVGNVLLELIKSETKLLPVNIFLILSIARLLEELLSIFTTFILLTNEVPYSKSILISGIMYIIIAIVLANNTELGILGMIISQLAVQSSFNYWYWPKYVLKKLQLSLRDLLYLGNKRLISLIKIKIKNNTI